jgi:hypothetical protein
MNNDQTVARAEASKMKFEQLMAKYATTHSAHSELVIAYLDMMADVKAAVRATQPEAEPSVKVGNCKFCGRDWYSDQDECSDDCPRYDQPEAAVSVEQAAEKAAQEVSMMKILLQEYAIDAEQHETERQQWQERERVLINICEMYEAQLDLDAEVARPDNPEYADSLQMIRTGVLKALGQSAAPKEEQ